MTSVLYINLFLFRGMVSLLSVTVAAVILRHVLLIEDIDAFETWIRKSNKKCWQFCSSLPDELFQRVLTKAVKRCLIL